MMIPSVYDHRDYYGVFYSKQAGQAGATFLFKCVHAPELPTLYLVELAVSVFGFLLTIRKGPMFG
jgi:hypothetical protein